MVSATITITDGTGPLRVTLHIESGAGESEVERLAFAAMKAIREALAKGATNED
jgi:hypothetical protein